MSILKMSFRTILRRAVIAAVVLFVVIQFVPYGRSHENPPKTGEPQWANSETRALAKRACFDCHSNESEWPWYSNIAPVSWLIQHDVNDGRHHFNVSEGDRPQRDAKKAHEELSEGEMPPWYYLPLHPGARLSEEEKKQLIEGLKQTFPEK